MINSVNLVGRMIKKPELRHTPNGVPVTNFTIAVNKSFKNEKGEREADFINCVVWKKPAESTAKYTDKGSLVGVNGSIQTRSYTNKEGNKVYITEVLANQVVFLDKPKIDEKPNKEKIYEELYKIDEKPNKEKIYEELYKIDDEDDGLPF